MGLDSFWELPEGKEEPIFDPPLAVCGGIFSANGQGSFRGKVYNDDIEHFTGVSLYQLRIPNKVVKQMANKLAKTKTAKYTYSDEEWEDVKRMFKTYAEAGADLVGWW